MAFQLRGYPDRLLNVRVTLWRTRCDMFRGTPSVKGKDFDAVCSTYPDDRVIHGKPQRIAHLHFFGRPSVGIISHEVSHCCLAIGRTLGRDLSGYDKRTGVWEEDHCRDVHHLVDIIHRRWTRRGVYS